MDDLKWETFKQIDIRVGTIIRAESLIKAKQPAYILIIDFGELGIKKSSAQITELYKIEDLIGTQTTAVVNFPSKQIVNIVSECLVLGVLGKKNSITLIGPNSKTKNGLRIG